MKAKPDYPEALYNRGNILSQLERYEEVRKKRDSNARTLEEPLARLSWHVGKNVNPAYLKLRLIVDPADAARAVSLCRLHGISVANPNWPRLVKATEHEPPHEHAQRAATFGLEIPVHQNLTAAHVAQIASAFAGANAPRPGG